MDDGGRVTYERPASFDGEVHDMGDDTVRTGPTQPFSTPPPAAIKLTSVRQVAAEIAARRAKLAELQATREQEQAELTRLREQFARVSRDIRALEAGVAKKNQMVFGLLGELDQLLLLDNRIKQRAQQLAREADRRLPASAAGAPAPAPAGKRAHERSPFATEVTLQGETNFYVGFSENISEGGLFVGSWAPRAIGERFLVTFQLPGDPAPVRCMVEVAWVNEFREGQGRTDDAVPGMGLRFVGLTPEDAARIARFQAEREPLFFPDVDEIAG
jgi:uncharacterized protein (TIGR02266 family)